MFNLTLEFNMKNNYTSICFNFNKDFLNKDNYELKNKSVLQIIFHLYIDKYIDRIFIFLKILFYKF